MSKFWLFLFILVIGGLMWFGIIEVNFNLPSDTSNISGLTNTIVKEKATYEKARSYVVSLKRRSELFIVRDREKRLVLSLLYVKNDAARLQDLLSNNASAASLLPQAELLVTSIDQVRSNAEKAPVEVVASLKGDSTEAFTTAQSALGGLREQYEEYGEIHSEFTRLTSSLEDQIGRLGLEPSEETGQNGESGGE